MDQLRQILAWLKQHHFWVLTLLIVAVALGCWMTASGTLREAFLSNQSKISGQFGQLTTLQQKPFHPNEEINLQQAREINAQAESVGQIWQELYDRQREEVLQWPTSLPEEFRDHVEDLKFGDPIRASLRSQYMNYVEGHFEELPKKIGARINPEGGGFGSGGYGRRDGGARMPRMDRSSRLGRETGMMPGGELDEADDDYICEWLDQDLVREKLYFDQRPSHLAIWVTQEDLWVYHTLLQIIANTNEAAGADRISNAAIRVIESLEVGQMAAQESRGTGRIHFEQPQAAPGEFGEMGGRGDDGGRMMSGDDFGLSPYGEGGRGMPGETPTAEMERAALLYGRYLDDDEKPIPAPETRDTPFMRLPVRMVMRMDVRWLPRLLVECGNQPLQVEVKEVRINPSDGGMGGGRGGYGGGRGGSGRDGGMGGSSYFDSSGRAGGIEYFESQPHIATVVIQGIIYIFNEPNPATLEVAGQETLAGM